MLAAKPHISTPAPSNPTIKETCEAYRVALLAFLDTEAEIEDQWEEEDDLELKKRLRAQDRTRDDLAGRFVAMQPTTIEDVISLASVIRLHEGARIVDLDRADATHDDVLLGLLLRGIAQLEAH